LQCAAFVIFFTFMICETYFIIGIKNWNKKRNIHNLSFDEIRAMLISSFFGDCSVNNNGQNPINANPGDG
jgi:hypothetical protein